MIDWVVSRVVEWWLLPGWLAKGGILLTTLALLSALVGGIRWVVKGVARLYEKIAAHERLAPLEGLTAGEPLPTPHFTGREEEKKLLAALIENHHVAAVAGPPLIGKSWLISEVIRSRGMEGRCIFVELKPRRGLSALLFAINAGLVRLGCRDFDAVCRRDDLTSGEKAEELRPVLVEGSWVIVLDAYERAEDGGEIDQTIQGWATGIGASHVVLGTRRNPSWLAEGAVLDVPPMPAAAMEKLCRTLGLTESEAEGVCEKLAGLPGAAGVFRGILERKGARAARRLVGKAPEKLGRTLFDTAFRAAPEAARDVWMVASWFPQPLTRETVFAICGEDVFKEGVALLERWTVVTEGAERLDLHAWAVRTGGRALWWEWQKRRLWGARAAAYYALFAMEKADDRAAVEGELENVLAAARLAYRYREWEALWGMGGALGERISNLGHWTACEELLGLCVEGAARAGNQEARAIFTSNLGIALQQRGRLGEAERLYKHAIDVFHEIRDRRSEAAVLHQLGMVAQDRGKLEEADGYYNESLEIEREVGDRPGEANTLHQLAMVAEIRGKLEAAEEYYNQSLEIEREIGNRQGVAQSLHQLGAVAQQRGKLERAEGYYEQGLEIFREMGARPDEARALHQLGMLAQDRGKLEEAEEYYNQSLEIKREVGDRPAEAATLHQLGNVAYLRRKLEDAEGWYNQSLEIKREVGDRPGEAITLAQMALLAEKQGDLRLAVERMERAAAMFEEMGLGEAEKAREELGRLRKRLGTSD